MRAVHGEEQRLQEVTKERLIGMNGPYRFPKKARNASGHFFENWAGPHAPQLS